jgi:hypothetical protein
MDFLRRVVGLIRSFKSRLDSYGEKAFRRFALSLYVLFAAAKTTAKYTGYSERVG